MRYFGQRAVEIALLKASFEPVKEKTSDGRSAAAEEAKEEEEGEECDGDKAVAAASTHEVSKKKRGSRHSSASSVDDESTDEGSGTECVQETPGSSFVDSQGGSFVTEAPAQAKEPSKFAPWFLRFGPTGITCQSEPADLKVSPPVAPASSRAAQDAKERIRLRKEAKELGAMRSADAVKKKAEQDASSSSITPPAEGSVVEGDLDAILSRLRGAFGSADMCDEAQGFAVRLSL